MDRKTYLPYSDPEKFTVFSPSNQTKELPRPRQNPAFWRGKKRIVITAIILAVFAAGIVIGFIVGMTRKYHTMDQPPPSRTSSSANSSNAVPTPPSTSALGPIPSLQPIPAALAAVFQSSSWIWQDAQGPTGVPGGNWAFRKTLPTSTAPAREAIALLTVDNGFQLYHNGQFIAENSTLGWQMATAVHVSLDPNSNVFAIQAHNSPSRTDSNANSAAGLLASIQILYTDGTTTTISSDATWRVTQPVPDGFQSPSFNDAQWQSAIVAAAYGSGPWGYIVIPPQVFHFPAR